MHRFTYFETGLKQLLNGVQYRTGYNHVSFQTRFGETEKIG